MSIAAARTTRVTGARRGTQLGEFEAGLARGKFGPPGAAAAAAAAAAAVKGGAAVGEGGLPHLATQPGLATMAPPTPGAATTDDVARGSPAGTVEVVAEEPLERRVAPGGAEEEEEEEELTFEELRAEVDGLTAAGEWAEAHDAMCDLLALARRQHGALHVRTLGCMLDYVAILQREGAWREALTLLDAAVAGYGVAVGEGHPDARRATSELAALLATAGGVLRRRQQGAGGGGSSEEVLALEEAGLILSRGADDDDEAATRRIDEAAAMYRPILQRLPSQPPVPLSPAQDASSPARHLGGQGENGATGSYTF